MREMFTVKEVAEMLKLTDRTIWKYIAEGKLNAIKILGNTRVPRKEIERLIVPARKEVKSNE